MIDLRQEPPARTLSRAVSTYTVAMTTATGAPFGSTTAGSALTIPEQSFLENQSFGIDITTPDGLIQTVYFVAKASPTAVGDVPVYNSLSGYADLETYLGNVVATKLNKHPFLTPFLRFAGSASSAGTPQIVATLNRDLVGYGVAWHTDSDWVDAVVTPIAAMSDPKPLNAQVRYSLYVENAYGTGVFTEAYAGVLLPDTEGGCVLSNLSDVLHTHCLSSGCGAAIAALQMPYTATIADNVRRYFIRFSEHDGSPIVARRSLTSAIKTVLMGGLTRHEQQDNFFTLTAAASRGILSFQTTYTAVSAYSPVFLNFINASEITVGISLRVSMYDAQGLKYFTRFFDQNRIVNAWETVCLPVDVARLEIDTLAAMYSVQVVDSVDSQTVNYSTPQYFTIDRVTSPDERILAYRNAFGAWEILRVVGIHATGSGIVRKEAILEGRQQAFNAEWKPNFTYRTGPISQAVRDALTEMLLGATVFEVLPDGYVELFVTATAIADTAIDDNLTVFELKCTPTKTDLPFSTNNIFADKDWATYNGLDGVRRFMTAF